MNPLPPPDRLLLRAPNWLGDGVMALPAVRALRRACPQTELTVAAPAKLAALWRACPHIDHILPLESPRHYGTTVAALRKGKFATALLFPNSFRSGLEARLAGIGTLVAIDQPLRNLLVAHRVPRRAFDPARLHQMYDYLALAAAFGADPHGLAEPGPLLQLPEEWAASAEAGAVVLCPGAAYGPAKRWPAERFAEVGRALAAQNLGPLIVAGAAGDAAAAAEVAALIPGARNAAGGTSLDEFMASIARARLVVTNDSGAMHLAAAFGVPGVAIFGSTEPKLTGPIGPSVRVERFHVPCSPCFRRECPIDFACMHGVSVDAVLAACAAALRP